MKQRYVVVLEGRDDAQPVTQRLGLALKLLLRAFRLKCVECRQATEAATTEAEAKR